MERSSSIPTSTTSITRPPNGLLIGLLAQKSLRTLIRQKQYQILVALSLVVVFGGLYGMHLLMLNQRLTFFTSEPYEKLSFDFECKSALQRGESTRGELHCVPLVSDDSSLWRVLGAGDARVTLPSSDIMFPTHAPTSLLKDSFDVDRQNSSSQLSSVLFGEESPVFAPSLSPDSSHEENDEDDKEVMEDENEIEEITSPTDQFYDWVVSGSWFSGNTSMETSSDRKILDTISSLMMSGLPIVGLDDYVQLSDWTNSYFNHNQPRKTADTRRDVKSHSSKSSGGHHKRRSTDSWFHRSRFMRDQLGNFFLIRQKRLLIRLLPYSETDASWIPDPSSSSSYDESPRSATRAKLMENRLDYIEMQHRCAEEFVEYLQTYTKVGSQLNIELWNDTMSEGFSKDDVWAIIQLAPPLHPYDPMNTKVCNMMPIIPPSPPVSTPSSGVDSSVNITTSFNQSSSWFNSFWKTPNSIVNFNEDDSHLVPEIVIRIHPSAIPDTRNYEWSPLKRAAPRQQSGQLLYFTSGFLTLQYELQSFLQFKQSPHTGFSSRQHSLGDLRHSLQQTQTDLQGLLSILTTSNDTNTLRSNLYNSSFMNNTPILRSYGYMPWYHRAYPTHEYTKSSFWHMFGTLVTILLVIFFSIPSAVTIGHFQREVMEGQLEVLCSLPELLPWHELMAWCICSWYWILLYGFGAMLFFAVVLEHSSVLLPVVVLLLLGLSLSPIASLLGLAIQNADALVLAIPGFAFIGLLPGLLYFDLAFDIQRSTMLELAICLLPPSAAALCLRQIFAYESLSVAVTWRDGAPVTGTPVVCYVLMLAFDVLIYSSLAQSFYSNKYGYSKGHGSLSIGSPTVRRPFSLRRWIVNLFKSIYHFFREKLIYLWTGHSPSNNNSNVLFEEVYEGVSHYDTAQSCSLFLSNVSKFYSLRGQRVTVLDSVTTSLFKNQVTVLLGSNGAGKTTLMRLLAGIDGRFAGQITLNEELAYSRRRLIGWCPQQEALFEGLTVEEHLVLFETLYHLTSGRASLVPTGGMFSLGLEPGENVVSAVRASEASFDLTSHALKDVSALSGGMKRRLSLAMACVGSPHILLLDEPTSGCDSWTRELVRKDILRRKSDVAVLVSTHHADDIEVLADHVWFLDDHTLAVDDAVAKVLAASDQTKIMKPSYYQNDEPSVDKRSDVDRSNRRSTNEFGARVYFSTEAPEVIRRFIEHFGAERAEAWVVDGRLINEFECSLSNSTWCVPSNASEELISLLEILEIDELRDWTIESPTIYKALSHLYGDTQLAEATPEDNESSVAETDPLLAKDSDEQKRKLSDGGSPWANQLRSTCLMRFYDVLSSLKSHLLLEAFVPFLVVLVMALACRDIRYPAVELTSANLGGLGEVLVTAGDLPPLLTPTVYPTMAVDEETRKLQSPGGKDDILRSLQVPNEGGFVNCTSDVKLLSSEDFTANLTESVPSATFLWRGVNGSDHLWETLRREYYDHRSHRWGALVAEDRISEWIETTIVLRQDSLAIAADELFTEVSDLRDELCNEMEAEQDANEEKSRDEGISEEDEDNSEWALRLHRKKKRKRIDASNSTSPKELYFCRGHPSFSIQLVPNNTHSHSRHKSEVKGGTDKLPSSNRTSAYLVIRSYQGLATNLTLLSNVTTDHAAPVFLKEVLPTFQYTLTEMVKWNNETCSASDNAENSTVISVEAEKRQPRTVKSSSINNSTTEWYPGSRFRLFSHPLSETGVVNRAFLERGYLGASVVTVYVLISTVSVVRSIGILRSVGMKRQLHLMGVGIVPYWIGNWLCDTLQLLVGLSAIYIAVAVGGEPLRGYFLDSQMNGASLFALSLIVFSGAAVASSYALVVLSSSALVSQLVVLVSTICGGIFLKLWLQRRSGWPYDQLSSTLIAISPTYVFASITADIFNVHANSAVGSSALLDPIAVLYSKGTYTYIWVMVLQIVGYLVITIVIDRWFHAFVKAILSLRWKFSAVRFTRHITPKLDLEMSPNCSPRTPRTPQTPSPGEGGFSRYGSVDLLAKNATQSPATSSLHQDYRIGLFPVVGNGALCASTLTYDPTLDKVTTDTEHNPWAGGLVAQNLCVGSPSAATLGLCNLNFHLRRSSRVALMGMNGGGKTTLFETLAFSSRIPMAGDLSIEGINAIDDLWKVAGANMIGYVPQEGGILPTLTVKQFLNISKALYGGTVHEKNISKWPSLLPAKFLSNPVNTLSGGTRKKLSVFLANVSQPPWLLLDECTTGVDPVAAQRIMRFMRGELAQTDQGLLFSSHRIDEMTLLCDEALLLLHGQRYLQAPMDHFQRMAETFFQVDITLRDDYVTSLLPPVTASFAEATSENIVTEVVVKEFLRELETTLGVIPERVVGYSAHLIRVTFQKRLLSPSRLWRQLIIWQQERVIYRYAFRLMETEELLATIFEHARR